MIAVIHSSHLGLGSWREPGTDGGTSPLAGAAPQEGTVSLWSFE